MSPRRASFRPFDWPRLGFVTLESAVLGLGIVFVRVGEERLCDTYGHRFTFAQVASALLLLALVVIFWARRPRLARVGLAILVVGGFLDGLELPSTAYR